jgi:hypothetical protein
MDLYNFGPASVGEKIVFGVGSPGPAAEEKVFPFMTILEYRDESEHIKT